MIAALGDDAFRLGQHISHLARNAVRGALDTATATTARAVAPIQAVRRRHADGEPGVVMHRRATHPRFNAIVMSTVPYRRAETLQQALNLILELKPSGVVVDVEPLVCRWGAGDSALAAGLASMATALKNETGPDGITPIALVFATNSQRKPAKVASQYLYLQRARKPWTRGIPRLPTPGGWVVCGDQMVTDGLLAWRLRAPFVHCVDAALRPPWWPRLQSAVADPVLRHLFFTSGPS